ncbi:SRPBCC family protein [Patiriisocius marinus]|uniref:SRPBCC family protein n=1 Tax=Patiriisocius marinus TaxID=1397112 RepID=A0A5J4IY40_9FLAO|nr:SRPBCC family protein [Patiriisocius marinus]GER59322.1 hypothetical protein ULMA_14300 [Patiriisocius marinus]
MKYSCNVEIEAPLKQVVALWKNEKHFAQWQDGFKSMEHLQGIPNTVGAKSRIKLNQGKREIVLIETILENNLPVEKSALYEHLHMSNTQTSRFEYIDDTHTRYISEVEYVKFNGFVPKLMSKLFPKLFKKQSQKWMNQFKVFAETSIK